MSKHAIIGKSLTKKYGSVVAVNDVGFEVRHGEIFGLLGPNGAGKTTTLEIVEGLQEPDSGEIVVLGDPGTPTVATRQRVGVLFQDTHLFREAKVKEILELFSSFYERTTPASELVERLSLGDKLDSYVQFLSGGQRQRLGLALALINNPEVLILDEPTTGLDPQARLHTWTLLLQLKEEGKTIFLTTHMMDEAERLCDRVAIMDHGRILACDSSRALKDRFQLQSVIEIQLAGGGQVQEERLRNIDAVSEMVRSNGSLKIFSATPYQILARAREFLPAGNVDNVIVHSATLEDVFLKLVGTEPRT